MGSRTGTKARLLGLFLLALAVRLPLLITQHDAYLSGGITTSLGLVARNLVEGRGLVETTGPPELLRLYDQQLSSGRLLDIREFPNPPDQPTKPFIQRMPGYPILLALIWKLTGDYRYLPVQILQVLLSAMLPCMMYGAGRRLFDEATGLTAGVIAAINLAEARLAVVPLYDWWIVFLAGFLIWFIVRSAARGYPLIDFVGIGLVVAAGVTFRATVLAIPVFVAAALLPRMQPRRAAVCGAIALGLPLLALVPWAVRNERIFHRPILTNTFFWATLWEGFGEVPNRFGAVLDDRNTYLAAVSENPRIHYGTPEYDDFFRPKVIRIASSHPEFIAYLWTHRLVRGLLFPGNPWGIPAAEKPEESLTLFRGATGRGPLAYLASKPLAALVKIAQRIWDPLLLFLALLAIAVDRHRWREFLPVLAFPAAFLASTVPLHLEGRYLLPGVLAWILFAAVPIAAWIGGPHRSSSRRRSESAPPAL